MRVQRTRSSPSAPRSPLTRRPLGGSHEGRERHEQPGRRATPLGRYRTLILQRPHLADGGHERAQMPTRRIAALGGGLSPCPRIPLRDCTWQLLRYCRPGRWASRAERLRDVTCSQGRRASRRMPSVSDMFKGWTWIFGCDPSRAVRASFECHRARPEQVGRPPNTRVQRTRSSPSALRSPLTRHPLGGGRCCWPSRGLIPETLGVTRHPVVENWAVGRGRRPQ